MSKTIKIQSLKNGSSVIKVKTVANEKYIIADETGKPLNKLNHKNMYIPIVFHPCVNKHFF